MLDAVETPARVAAAVADLIRIVLKLFCLEAICLNIISTLNAKIGVEGKEDILLILIWSFNNWLIGLSN